MKHKKIIMFILTFVLTFYILNFEVKAETNYNYIKSNEYLVVNGKDIVINNTKKRITLRGLNIGGWLLQTGYMTNVSAYGINTANIDQTTINNILHSRFSSSQVNELLNAYYDNYITTTDLDMIAKTGANVIRVPFWWKNFMNDDGTFITDSNKNIDFSRLDFIVNECRKRGIYVILDLHGAPGSQSGSMGSGLKTDNPTFFGSSADGRSIAVKLWTEIAKHFKDNPAVAGYDILNEPYGESITNNRNLLWNFYSWVYNSIRRIDTKHIIIFETNFGSDIKELINYGLKSDASINKVKWQNVVYSSHVYCLGISSPTSSQVENTYTSEINSIIKLVEKYSVPYYMGELSCYNRYEQCKKVLDMLDKYYISYTLWSYKFPSAGSFGLIYSNSKNVKKVDISKSAFSTIKSVWSIKSSSYTFNNSGYKLLLNQFGGRIVRSITINSTNFSLNIGNSKNISATILPNNALNKEIIWKSSNSNVARVDKNGLVTAVGVGNAYIVAKSKEDENIKSSILVTVKNISVESIALNKTNMNLKIGDTSLISAIISPSNALNKEVIWKSSNSNVAKVDANGLITAVSVGNVYVVAKLKENENIKANILVTVKPIDKNLTIIDGGIIAIETGDFLNISSIVSSEIVNDKNINWTTSNESVIKINDKNIITAIGEGTAYLTGQSDDKKIKYEIKVVNDVNNIINSDNKAINVNLLNKELSLYENSNMKLLYNFEPNMQSENQVIWSSSDNDTVTVDNFGNIHTLKEGTAFIIVSLESNPNISDKCKIEVKRKNESTISVTNISVENNIEVKLNTSKKISVLVEPDDATDKSLIWSIENDKIISISEDGTIFAKSIGKTKIHVFSNENPYIEKIIIVTVVSNEVKYYGVILKAIIAFSIIFITFILIVIIKKRKINNSYN